MKPSHLAALVCLTASATIADTDLTREQAGKIKSLDAQQLHDSAPLYDGQIVKLKFNRRLSATEPQPDGSLHGSANLNEYAGGLGSATNTYRYGTVSVVVPKEGIPWFMKITTQYEAPKSNVVYARISSKTGAATAELLGVEVKTDIKGSHIVWSSH